MSHSESPTFRRGPGDDSQVVVCSSVDGWHGRVWLNGVECELVRAVWFIGERPVRLEIYKLDTDGRVFFVDGKPVTELVTGDLRVEQLHQCRPRCNRTFALAPSGYDYARRTDVG